MRAQNLQDHGPTTRPYYDHMVDDHSTAVSAGEAAEELPPREAFEFMTKPSTSDFEGQIVDDPGKTVHYLGSQPVRAVLTCLTTLRR